MVEFISLLIDYICDDQIGVIKIVRFLISILFSLVALFLTDMLKKIKWLDWEWFSPKTPKNVLIPAHV